MSHFWYESAAARPVQAGVNIFLRMREHQCPGATLVSYYPTAQGLRSVSASDIIVVLWAETIWVRAAQFGFASEEVGTHSLRSGGAMAMHISDVPDRTLMVIGR